MRSVSFSTTEAIPNRAADLFEPLTHHSGLDLQSLGGAQGKHQAAKMEFQAQLQVNLQSIRLPLRMGENIAHVPY
jgi:hypothetical protein